ncbi:MAG: sensor histidine kinase, partial [Pseudomonadota bacterium]|nr:sensor histidine kinase [Pseudomonadota bacterium]
LATTPAPDAFATAFLGRIHSMAKSYSLISEAQWGSVSLATILATELEPYRRDDSDRIAVDGPDVAFAPQQALAMGLVFHELATNAAKYGALSTTEGNIKATWQLKNGLLQVDWIETGGPKPRKRRTPGFGTRLISSQVRAAFGAEVRYDYGATGLQVSFAMPRDSFLSETGN